ncbi:MAG TPA: gliding motility-associated C-terminal domain-containing protein [Edaphocola sp.]|nr:gliding motility-associated C-terminal domain-containing protein [Edaphocola sp.]
MRLLLLILSVFLPIVHFGQSMLINPNTDGGFEMGNSFAANGWTVVNNPNNNGNDWYLTNTPLSIGFYSFPLTNNRAAYISQTPNGPWTYNINQNSTTHIYKEVSFPAGMDNIQLKFRWNAFGEGPVYDVLYVYSCPITLTPVQGEPSGTSTATNNWLGTGASILHKTLHSSNINSGKTETIQLPASFVNTSRRLVFTWKNGSTLGNMPPAAIDSIWLYSDCIRPSISLTQTSTSPCSAEIWVHAIVNSGMTNGTFKWYVAGVFDPSQTSAHYYTNGIPNNTIVTCIYNDNNICGYEDTVSRTVIASSSFYKTDTLQVCNGDLPLNWRGITIPVGAGSNPSYATKTIQNVDTCDSVFTLNLMIKPSPPITIDTINICRGRVALLTWRGKSIPSNAISNSRFDSVKIASPNGCDSVFYLNLNVFDTATYIQQTINSCKAIDYQGKHYTQTTTLFDTLRNSMQCDSIIYITQLNIHPFDLSLKLKSSSKFIEGEAIKIAAESPNSNFEILSWYPPALFPNVLSAIQTLNAPENLTVSVIAKSDSGCLDTAYLHLVAMEINKNVVMPNAFSPNGDGKNDIFQAVLSPESNAAIKKFVVFNRWGQSVYDAFSETKNIGWDGTFNGKPADVGLYFYKILIVFPDKSEFQKSGEVYLLR